MTAPFEFFAHGLPAPQGSKKHVGGGRMVESSKNVKPWREAVKFAVLEANKARLKFHAPVRVEIEFYFARPKSRKKDVHHCTAPDLDKLCRSTLDALTDSGIIVDDSLVADLRASKFYVVGDKAPGASIRVGVL